MVKTPDLKTMIDSGMHFGHQVSRWYPKMKPFIYTQKDGVHIIDLTKTKIKLEEAIAYVQKIVANDGKVLFVGVKKQTQPIVKKYAEECEMPYMAGKWIGGLLTNFSITIKSVKRYKTLKKTKESAEFAKYTKKEQSQINKEIDKLDKKVSGLVNMDKFPQAIFLVDMRKAKTALEEANKRKMPIIAICDTNCNPDLVNYPIPANDDSVKSIELVVSVISEAIIEAKKTVKTTTPIINK
jgi:small subunit ribosomal protein S2